MIRNKNILVAGGDLRNVYLAKLLKKENTVYTLGFDKLNEIKNMDIPLNDCKAIHFDYIILPINPSQNGILTTPFSDYKFDINEILALCNKNTFLLVGKADKELIRNLEKKSISYCDYFEREELQILNAVPTAQGALKIAFDELPLQFKDTKVLITGYGRIGKVLSKMASAIGAKVFVAARNVSDLAWIKVNDLNPIKFSDIKCDLDTYDVIFNTVPQKIFTKDLLSNLKKDCLIIDLASNPGGIDLEAGKELSLNIIWALSLPGKTAPKTAGQIIYDTIVNILSERRSQN